MTKAEWQRTPQYQALRLRVCKAQRWCCADCGAFGRTPARGPWTSGPITITQVGGGMLTLELHHLVYPYNKIVHDGPGWWGDEEDSDVVGLCRRCHHQRHRDINGDFWADPQEMAARWEAFEDAMDKD
jgi:hypothetical protein